MEQGPRLQNSDMMRSSRALSLGSGTADPVYYNWGAYYDDCSRDGKWLVERIRSGQLPLFEGGGIVVAPAAERGDAVTAGFLGRIERGIRRVEQFVVGGEILRLLRG